MSEFLMPSLGSDMEAGTLISREKGEGDKLRRGDIIAVVETQKGAIEVEIFENGVLEEWLIDIGKTVPVGTALARIRPESETEIPTEARAPSEEGQRPYSSSKSDSESVGKKTTKQAVSIAAGLQTAKDKPGTFAVRTLITPAARKLAEDKGIKLELITGTGPNGEIVRLDVLNHAPSREPDSQQPITQMKLTADKFSAMRQVIATSMARSKREIPHYYLSDTIDLNAATQFVEHTNLHRPPENRILVSAIFIQAVARAIKRFPEFNGFYIDNEFRPSVPVHLGFAINIRGAGLVAPAIHHVQDKSLDHTMDAMRDLITRVRAGRFRSSELNDPTITVSSLGERGVEALHGVIYPPQVALIGFGTPVSRPWVVDGRIEPRTTVCVTLAADHRVSDGHRGALFLRAIHKSLSSPEDL